MKYKSRNYARGCFKRIYGRNQGGVVHVKAIVKGGERGASRLPVNPPLTKERTNEELGISQSEILFY